MAINIRELCPKCVNFTEVTEKTEIVREDSSCQVQRIVRYCQSCNQELTNTVKLKFKSKMG